MSYKGGYSAEFGIIDNFDAQKDYSASYEPEKYHCVAICEYALNDWWDSLSEMKTYFNSFSRPEKNLARCGVTLIPPDSLELLIAVIDGNTKEEFRSDGLEIIDILKKAKSENKFVIHYGV